MELLERLMWKPRGFRVDLFSLVLRGIADIRLRFRRFDFKRDYYCLDKLLCLSIIKVESVIPKSTDFPRALRRFEKG